MTTSKWQIKILLKAIGYPILITLSSFIPVVNYKFLFHHGGIGWLLLLLSFPWVLGVIIVDIKKHSKADIKNHVICGVVILILYLIISFPLAMIFQKGALSIGNAMELKKAYELFVFPFSLLFH